MQNNIVYPTAKQIADLERIIHDEWNEISQAKVIKAKLVVQHDRWSYGPEYYITLLGEKGNEAALMVIADPLDCYNLVRITAKIAGALSSMRVRLEAML